MIPPRCLIVQGHLGRFVDGALPEERSRTIHEHLAVCARCLEAERMARAIPFMLSSRLAPPPPPTLLPRLLKGVRRRRWRERQAAALVAGLVLLSVCGGLMALRPRAEAERAPAVRVGAAVPAPVAAGEADGILQPARPEVRTVAAAPTVGQAYPSPLNVGRFTVSELASPCPAAKTAPAAGGQNAGCRTKATPRPSNRP